MARQGARLGASVIIVNWNGRHFLKECLDSVFAQTCKDFEVILVDNGSTDGSMEFVRKAYPKVRVLENASNLGFAEGNNVGFRAAKGRYIVPLNNDTKAHPRFLEALLKCAEKGGRRLGSVGSRMLYYSQPHLVNSTGIAALKDGGGRDRGVNKPNSGEWSKGCEIFGPCAGAALYLREALEDVKEGDDYFDPSFFAYFEDVDLAHRLRLRGWKSLYCPDAVVLHHGRGTSRKISDFNIYYGNANRLKVIIKDFPRGLIIRFLPWILLRQMFEFFYYTVLHLSLAPTRARLRVLSELGSLLRKRRGIQSRRRVGDSQLAAWLQTPPLATLFSERFIKTRAER